jgi:hypothetical protein
MRLGVRVHVNDLRGGRHKVALGSLSRMSKEASVVVLVYDAWFSGSAGVT